MSSQSSRAPAQTRVSVPHRSCRTCAMRLQAEAVCCHIDPAASRECSYRRNPVWHRHSCLCLGDVQSLIFYSLASAFRFLNFAAR
jgi:hypothetical protein